MLPEQQQRILGYFIEEAKDHLNTIEQGLLSLQNTIDDPEMLREVYRAAHSVKGGAGMLGLKSIQKTAHLLEDCFKILEGSPVRVDQKLESLFLRVFDTLQSLVEQLQGPFGLTEDVAESLMSAIEPVFTELEKHLEVLVGQPGGVGAPVGSSNESLLAAFKQVVMEQLRQMLQLFKPPRWPDSREQLVDCCDVLKQQAAGLNVPAWSNLLDLAAGAIANPDNNAQLLAPIIIKEIKQAQDLVLKGAGAQIPLSTQLQALQPVPSSIDAPESELEEFLEISGDEDEDWFGEALANEEPAPALEFDQQPETIDPNAATPEWEQANPTPTKANTRQIRPAIRRQSPEDDEMCVIIAATDPVEPVVATAELSNLADLFDDADASEIDTGWQQEQVLGEASGEQMLSTFDELNRNSNDFSDLFEFEQDAGDPSAADTPEDDTVTLFGQTFLDENAAQELAAAAQKEYGDLYGDDSAMPQPTPDEQDDIPNTADLFGDADIFLQDEGDAGAIATGATPVVGGVGNERVSPPTAIAHEEAFDDLFADEAAILDGTPTEADDAAGLFGDDLFGDNLEEARLDFQSAATPLDVETNDLSELFDGLNENDLWAEDANGESDSAPASFAPESELEDWASLGLRADDSADEFGFGDLELDEAQDLPSEMFVDLESAQPARAGGYPIADDTEMPATESNEEAEIDQSASQTLGEASFDFDPDRAAESEMALESMDFNWALESDNGEETPELAFLMDDFDPNSLFPDASATTPEEEVASDFDLEASGFLPVSSEATDISGVKEVDSLAFGSAQAMPNASDTSFDDFFSLDEDNQSGQEPAAADLGIQDNWLGMGDDLFADMGTGAIEEASLGSAETSSSVETAVDGDEGVDLFGEAEADDEIDFDLFEVEAEAPDEASETAIASVESSELADFSALDPVDGDENALDWIDQITQDVGDDDEEELLLFSDDDNQQDLALELFADDGEADEAMSLTQFSDEDNPEAELDLFGEDIEADADLSLDQLDLAANLPADDLGGEDIDFDDLQAFLDDNELASEPVVNDASGDFDFADLEVLLGDEVDVPEPPPVVDSKATSKPDLTAKAKAKDDEFDDLEVMLGNAIETLPGPSPIKPKPGQANAPRVRPRIEQTMKVPVKQLDNLTNLVGELVVNRNSLEQDQEKLRQFLENLLHQVQQLSDVGARMQDLYERSLLESALLASRQSYRFSTTPGDTANGYTSPTWDHIEMDRFTPFHSLSQEMIELIVRVREASSDIEYIVDETEQVSRQFRQVSTQLQEGLTRARMVPFGEIERVFPLLRYVRDKAAELGKQAELRIEGRETLIDKLILEHLSDPLKHLINNALAHGIEAPEIRQSRGKPPVGRISLSAFHQGNQTVISFSDDGAGIDVERLKAKAVEKRLITVAQAKALSRLEAYELLYLSGLSTKDKKDLMSGAGVGMDVVRTNVSEIRGTITTDSNQGKGTTFTIRLPLTLSICKALCCVSSQARIAFPMDGVEDALDIPKERVHVNTQGDRYIQWRDMQLPFKHLNDLLAFNRQIGRGRVYGANKEEDSISTIVLRSAGNFIAVQVDQVIGEQEIVIKQLEGPVPKPIGIAGATVMGDGRIMPIGDVLELIDLSLGRVRKEQGGALWEQNNLLMQQEAPVNEPRVLIVDDSITVRELLSMTFNKAGYRVEQARDGQEAWDKLKSGLPCDIVFCDIEMPRMDGLELLSRLNKDPELSQMPVAMLTSRGAEKHRQLAFELGASGYFTKPYLEEALLDAASRMLKGEKLVTTNISAAT